MEKIPETKKEIVEKKVEWPEWLKQEREKNIKDVRQMEEWAERWDVDNQSQIW